LIRQSLCIAASARRASIADIGSIFAQARIEAAEDATRLLGRFWLGRIPVEPFELARALGVHADRVRLDDTTSGALIKEHSQAPKIVVNAGDGKLRQRFTCAHELGHYVRRGDEEEYRRIYFRNEASGEGRYPEEVFANEFAGCLLMPEDYVLALHREGLFAWEMAERFVVSRRAMQRRLKRLGLS
jgi:Zn-dependent peptidase ImmA (M78 family)